MSFLLLISELSPFEQLNIWNNCDTVIIRWRSAQTPEIVTGNIVMETVYQQNTWKIETVYSEFNSGAWLVNLGVFTPSNCTSTSKRSEIEMPVRML